jgi:hypothetical protein
MREIKFRAWDCVFVSDEKKVPNQNYGFKCHEWKFCVEVIGNIHENPELLRK